MKVLNSGYKTEPYTSTVEILEEDCPDAMHLKKGRKIIEFTYRDPFYKVIIEMEDRGRVILDELEGIAIVIENDTIVNLGDRVFKMDNLPEDDLLEAVANATGLESGDAHRLIGRLKASGLDIFHDDS